MSEPTTPNPNYRYEPKQAESIVLRAFDFDFPEDLDPLWARGNPVRSHLFNGLSLTMPYLEPYLIKSTKEAAKRIHEPHLLEDIAGFNGQEARHFQCHRRMNEIIKKNGYPELAAVEERFELGHVHRLDDFVAVGAARLRLHRLADLVIEGRAADRILLFQ